jgi:protein involved in polysaccharide export with SLBB domain
VEILRPMIRFGARALVLALILSLGLAACGGGAPTAGSPAAPGPSASGDAKAVLADTVYKLGSGDKVKVVVFNHEDLSGEFTLDGAGNFAMPLIGEVQAGGLTSRDLEQRIASMYKQGYLVDPQVSVEVENYRPFYILGEVKNPGSYPYVNGMTVLNAVALAGGFTYRAKQNSFLLQRGGSNNQGVAVGGDQAILPGDIVTVQERFF